jgi:type II secretion system protein C
MSVAALVSIGAGVTALSLWAGGFPPRSWVESTGSKQVHKAAVAQQARKSATPERVQKPPVDIATAFPGIKSSVSKERRSLILTGTILGQNLRDGFAFIGVDERNPQTYAAGATLANGAQLIEIAKDFVVLEKNGESVRLYAQNVKSHGRARSDLLMVGAPQGFSPAVPTNTEAFTEFIRPNPVYEGDVLTGYEVYAGSSAGVFSRLGFQPGDIITAFDGVPISDPQIATELLQQLTTGAAMTATVKRKGKTEHLSLDGSIVSAELERVKNVADRGVTDSRGPPT